MKRVLSLILASLMVLALFSACTKGNGGTEDEATTTTKAASATTAGTSGTTGTTAKDVTDGKLFDSPVTLSVMVHSNMTYPTDPELYIYKKISELTNVICDYNVVADANYKDKAELVMASRNLPDIMAGNIEFAGKYGMAGAFIDVQDYLDKAPNFSMYYHKPEEKMMISNFKAFDGKIYGFPSLAYQGNNRHIWYYRKDILDQNNLSAPDDYNELYDVCAALKKVYPDYYPLYINKYFWEASEVWGEIRHMTIAWGSDHPFNFNQETETWELGLRNEGYKAFFMWMKKMYDEELIPQDFATMAEDQYREMLGSGKGFMSVYYYSDLHRYNSAFKANNEDAYFEYMIPPKGMVDGQHATMGMGFANNIWMISADSQKIDEAVKYCDWFYSDFAYNFCTWGEEGKTYKAVDGMKQYILPEGREEDGPRKVYGFCNHGTFRLLDPAYKIASVDPIMAKGFMEQANYEIPYPPLSVYSEEEQKIASNELITILQKIPQELCKFIMGNRDFNEWDKFIQEIENLGVDKVLKIKNDAYQRSNN